MEKPPAIDKTNAKQPTHNDYKPLKKQSLKMRKNKQKSNTFFVKGEEGEKRGAFLLSSGKIKT